MRMACHAHELDGLPVARLWPDHHGDVDAAAVVARRQIFLAIAVADHLEQISVLERLQRVEIVDLLQAEDVSLGRGDGERAQLARIVGERDRARHFQLAIFRFGADIVERQSAILVKLVAESREIEPVHQVFDIECSEAQRHRPVSALPRTALQRPWRATAGTMPFIARSCPKGRSCAQIACWYGVMCGKDRLQRSWR